MKVLTKLEDVESISDQGKRRSCMRPLTVSPHGEVRYLVAQKTDKAGCSWIASKSKLVDILPKGATSNLEAMLFSDTWT